MIVQSQSSGVSIRSCFFASLIVLNLICSITFIVALAVNGIKNSNVVTGNTVSGKSQSAPSGNVLVTLANVE